MFEFIKNLLKREKLDYPTLLNQGAIIIDVRTPQEFAQGHTDGSINIPLSIISNEIEKIKNYDKPIITCCRSGARSGKAAGVLKSANIEVYNGGSWGEVQSALTKQT